MGTEFSQAEALAEIGRLITSSTDFGGVFEATADRISAFIPAETISLCTVDVNQGTFTTLFRWGLDLPTGSIGLPRNLAGTALESAVNAGTPQIISQELRAKQTLDWNGTNTYPLADMKSWLIAPLVVGGKSIGALHLRTKDADLYTSEHLQMIERIANQIAGPVALAELHRELQTSEQEQSALAQLAIELASSESANEMYESIDRTLASFFDFDRISIVTVEGNHEKLIQRYQRGIAVEGIEDGTILSFSGSESAFSSWANQLRGTYGEREYPSYPTQIDNHKSMGIESLMRVPFVTKTGYVGAIALNQREPNMFSASDQELFRRVASQAAPALEKSFLLERAESEKQILQSLARIGRVVSEDLDLERVYIRVADELEKLVPYDRISVSVFDEKSQSMTADFYRGISIPGAMPGDDLTDSNKTVNWEYGGLEASSAESDFTPVESDFEKLIKSVGLVSWIQVPFGVQATGPIGFLSLRSKTPNQYDATDVELLRQVASQVTPAIQNARLFKQSLELSDQINRAASLDEANRELQLLADARSQFLSTVSHELRTPLTAISAFSDILGHNRPGNLEERQLSHIEAIRRSTSALTSLVDDLLDVSSADVGKLALDRAPFDFQALIDDFSITAESLASQKHQRVIIQGFENPVWLNGDQSRMSQILNNIISNAVKYSAQDADISINASDVNGHINVEIIDTGIGISDQNLGSVFEPFFRAENPETQMEKGTGLGLSVVKTLVELHGGAVTIHSELGTGTKVNFWVPGVVESPELISGS